MNFLGHVLCAPAVSRTSVIHDLVWDCLVFTKEHISLQVTIWRGKRKHFYRLR